MSASAEVARMLTLVPWFLQRPGASLDEAADAFGVPARTIRQDLGHLDFCGLPGLGGGALFDVTIEGDRVVVTMAPELRRPMRPNPREAVRLLVSLQAVDQAFGDEITALRSAIDKVREALGLPSSAVAVDEGSRPGSLEAIQDGLGASRRLKLGYQGRTDDEPRDRVVEPWRLDVTSDGWYLHAHDLEAADHRVFRLDRVVDVQVLDDVVTHPRPDELPEPAYEPDPDAVTMTVRLGRPAHWLAHALAYDTADLDGDVLEMTFRTDAPDWVARLLLMGAPDVTVVAPEAEVARFRDAATSALAAYA